VSEIVDVWRRSLCTVTRRRPGPEAEDAHGFAFLSWLGGGGPASGKPAVAMAAGVARRAIELLDPTSRRQAAWWVQPIARRLQAACAGVGLVEGQAPGEAWRLDLEALLAAGWGRRVIAHAAGVSPEALRLWERGERSPRAAAIEGLRVAARGLRCALTRGTM